MGMDGAKNCTETSQQGCYIQSICPVLENSQNVI